MSDFEQWWSGIYAIPSDEEAFARFVWQAAIASMQGEAKKLHMVEPDHRLIGCANCGSHDVGAGNTTAHCYGCKGKVHGENIEDTIEKWNKKQLATLSTRSAARIAEQDARIKELEQQLEVARKDAERYRFVRMPPVGRMNVISWDSRIGKYNDCVGHALDQAIDAAIRQIGGAE